MFYQVVIIALITFIYGSSQTESATIDTTSNYQSRSFFNKYAVIVFYTCHPINLNKTFSNNLGNTIPTFEDSTCPENYPDNHFCIAVTFPNSAKDMLILTKVPGTSIFEGFLKEDDDVSVVMIDTPATKKRMVIMNMVL